MNARSLSLSRQIISLISRTKRIPASRLSPSTHLYKMLGFDIQDLVDIILILERKFGIVIPDEVPIDTVGDLIRCVASNNPHQQAAA